jgi:hypothetical protein
MVLHARIKYATPMKPMFPTAEKTVFSLLDSFIEPYLSVEGKILLIQTEEEAKLRVIGKRTQKTRTLWYLPKFPTAS